MREYIPKGFDKSSYRIICAVIRQYPKLEKEGGQKKLKGLKLLKFRSVCGALDMFSDFEKSVIRQRFFDGYSIIRIDAPFCDKDKQKICARFIREVGQRFGEI
mgnify:FL=1